MRLSDKVSFFPGNDDHLEMIWEQIDIIDSHSQSVQTYEVFIILLLHHKS